MLFLNSAEAAAQSGAAGILGSPIFMFVIIIAIMYFMMIRPQRKRQKEIENFRRGLQPGVEVVTSGGIYGKIKEVNNGVVVLEIAKHYSTVKSGSFVNGMLDTITKKLRQENKINK